MLNRPFVLREMFERLAESLRVKAGHGGFGGLL